METKPIVYPEFVQAICKPGEEIVASITPEEAHVIHMIMGLSGEVGELLDAIKKSVIYRKKLDFKNLVEELGDIEFYLQGIRNAYCINREVVVQQNIHKLMTRYESGRYSNAQAIARADKAGHDNTSGLAGGHKAIQGVS